MAEQVKFTAEELDIIKELQQGYVSLQNTLGQVSVTRIRLQQQITELDQTEANIKNQFLDVQARERNFVAEVNKKYGDGNLDLTTGVFTPKVTTEEANKTL